VSLDDVRRPIAWIAAVAVAILGIRSMVGHGSALDLWRLQRERTALRAELFRLLRENDDRRQRILAFRRSDRTLERLARQELGLVREGEIVYRFAPAPRPNASAESRRR
jgi:cell division protein FtsB